MFQIRIPVQIQTTYFCSIIYKKNFLNFAWDIEIYFKWLTVSKARFTLKSYCSTHASLDIWHDDSGNLGNWHD